MKVNSKLVIIAQLIVMAIAQLVALVVYFQRKHEMILEIERLERNADIQAQALDTIRDAYGRAVVRNERLEMTIEEVLRDKRKLASDLEEMGVKLRHAKSLSKTVNETRAKIWGQIDTVSKDNEGRDTPPIAQIRFDDSHITVTATIDSAGLFDGYVQSVDTIVQVIERVPKRFLCFRYGTKGIRQIIRSSNPHTKIVYSDYIELQ